jgi:uncharacterized protein YegJ (DUF2314 family)
VIRLASIIVLAAALAAAEAPPQGPASLVPASDTFASEVFTRAQRNVAMFIQGLRDHPGALSAFQIRATDGDQSEAVWLTRVSYSAGRFSGVVEVAPTVVKTVAQGQYLTVNQGQITDWYQLQGQQMIGNYTLRVMLPSLPPEQAAAMAKGLAPEPPPLPTLDLTPPPPTQDTP